MCAWNVRLLSITVPKISAEPMELIKESDNLKLISSHGQTKVSATRHFELNHSSPLNLI